MVLSKSSLGLISILLISIFAGCVEKTSKSNFTFVSISDNGSALKNPTNVAESVLERKFGEDWHKIYQIDGTVKYQTIQFDHIFVRINPSTNPPYFFPNFSLLFTAEKVYFLSAEDFNKFVNIYGSSTKLEKNEIVQLIDAYLKLYGAQDESIFAEKDLREWTEEKRKKNNMNPEKFHSFDIVIEEKYYRVQFYTRFKASSYPGIFPSPSDLIISEYDGKIGTKGEVFLTLINRTKYEQFLPRGPR